MAELDDALQHILRLIRQDSFGGRDAPVVSVSPDTGVGADGRLHGELRVHLRRRNGEMALLDSRSLDGLASRSDLEDAFADVLSRVLGAHNNWPR